MKANTILKYLCDRPIIPGFLLLIYLSACSGEDSIQFPDYAESLENVTVLDPDAEPVYSVSFEEIYSVGNREPVLFSRVNEIEVDDQGYLYAAESFSGQETIYVFDGEGHPLTTIGRHGAGPGEFRSIFSLSYKSGMLYVLDYNLRRFQGFSTESYNSVQIADLNSSQWDISGENTAVFPHRIEALTGDSLLGIFNYLTFETDQLLLYHIDQTGSVISDRMSTLDYIRHLRDPVESGRAYYDPFGGRGLISVSDDGRIYYLWSEDFLIRVLDSNGNDLYAFYYPVDRAELDRTEALNFYGSGPSVASFQRTVRSDGIPDRWRAIEHMIVDDENRIWVSVITEDNETYDWWITDKRGDLLAKFTWPRSRVVKEVKNEILYALQTDEDTGVHQVIAYRIKLNQR